MPALIGAVAAPDLALEVDITPPPRDRPLRTSKGASPGRVEKPGEESTSSTRFKKYLPLRW
ncbi:unnamed protein product [Protopolystoma xenopodis]|uniref:Uncharacterized protein n=1 Tax=Protopolystoma xenopodis TaxID=117903 RepID=A0A3S5ANA2_9PLAT|nr:unnamed protein product [Protopolystoma xenopodis]